jgi:hypothetical protein
LKQSFFKIRKQMFFRKVLHKKAQKNSIATDTRERAEKRE